MTTAPVSTALVEAVPVEAVPVDAVPVDTVPVDTVPVDTVPVDTAAPETTVPPWQPPPIPEVVLGLDGQPVAEAPMVRPPAAWASAGIPQPGSMFENLGADTFLDPAGKFVALTFDDGPGQHTPQILDILKSTMTPATFFMLTPQAERRQDLVRQMVADGFRVGLHSKNHANLDDAMPWAKIDEIAGSHDQLNAIVGPGVAKCFRPPYGALDQYALDVISSRGLATAMWSIDTLDWQKPDWTVIVNRVMDQARSGSVILLHDGGGDRAATIQALPWIILGLRARGFTFVPVC
ncbi:MAG: polysaccharide deacetylase family protein [Actinobacteria bacterium]|nr:polysaccharide deacetylase family protein [Actinomycetota bacterium]